MKCVYDFVKKLLTGHLDDVHFGLVDPNGDPLEDRRVVGREEQESGRRRRLAGHVVEVKRFNDQKQRISIGSNFNLVQIL